MPYLHFEACVLILRDLSNYSITIKMVNNYIIKSQSFLLLNFVTAVMIEADKFIFLPFIKPDNLSEIDFNI